MSSSNWPSLSRTAALFGRRRERRDQHMAMSERTSLGAAAAGCIILPATTHATTRSLLLSGHGSDLA